MSGERDPVKEVVAPDTTAAPIVLMDASIYIFRAYFSMPPHWLAVNGYSTEAVMGYGRVLLDVLTQVQPRYMAVCFDESLTTCFRNDIYPQYKSSRVLPDEALAFQLQACQELTQRLGVTTFAHNRYEADDLLGSLMHQLSHQYLSDNSTPLALMSGDKDLAQLILRPQDIYWDYGKKEPQNRQQLQAKWGLDTPQLIDYLALVGDPVDDIPGVPGIGAKTATALLQVYTDVEAILANLDNVMHLPIRGAKSLAHKLYTHSQQLRLSKQLTTIATDVEVINGLNDIALNPIRDDAGDYVQELGLAGALGRRLTALQKVIR